MVSSLEIHREIIAERIYGLKSPDGAVSEMRVGLEQPEHVVYHVDKATGTSRSRWECSAYIESAEVSKRITEAGGDSLDALCGALTMILISIKNIAAITDSEVTYGEESDLLAGILLTVSLLTKPLKSAVAKVGYQSKEDRKT